MSAVDPVSLRSPQNSLTPQAPAAGQKVQIAGQTFEYRPVQVRPGEDLISVVAKATGQVPGSSMASPGAPRPSTPFDQLFQLTGFSNGLTPGQPLRPGTTLMVPHAVKAEEAASPSQKGDDLPTQPVMDTFGGPARAPAAAPDAGVSREEWARGKPAATEARSVDASRVDQVRKQVEAAVESFQQAKSNPAENWTAANRRESLLRDLSGMQPPEFKHLVDQLEPKDLGRLLEMAKTQSPAMLQKLEQLAVQTDQPTVAKLQKAAYEVANTDLADSPKDRESLQDVGRAFGSMKALVPENLPIQPDKTHIPQPGEHNAVQIQSKPIGIGKEFAGTALQDALQGGKLDLNKVTPQMLKDLDPSQRKSLMDQLQKHSVQVEAKDPGGHLTTGGVVLGRTTEMSAATALAAKMWASGDTQAFAKTLAAGMSTEAGQTEMLSLLQGQAARVLTPETLATVFSEMNHSPLSMDQDAQRGFGKLVERCLEFTGSSEPKNVMKTSAQLVKEIQGRIEITPENIGTAAGCVVGGMRRYLDGLAKDTERRKEILGGVKDLAEGVLPFAGLAEKAADLSELVIKVAFTAYNELDRPLDSETMTRRIQGALDYQLKRFGAQNGWSQDQTNQARNDFDMGYENASS